MIMIYTFLATGFEDIEALAPIDIMRRAGLPVETVSITDERIVTSAHGVGVVADRTLAEIDFADAELLFLPGGLPGATNLDACAPLREGLMAHHKAGRPIAAICAAPLVLGHLGLLDGMKSTCYPGFETELGEARYTAALVEQDGQFITGKGPGAAFALGYALVERLKDKQTADQLREGMMYNFLMSGK
ncbi:MAG: DJ-1/PfpI family protein [Bacteroidaceae bacterium]|nr:DJ-1/PfpI family protein [Bacteroidaceae bacterium]